MDKINNWDEINASGESQRLNPGNYVIKVRKVINHQDKQYLELQFEIMDDPYKDYIMNSAKNLGKWPTQGIYRASYKDSATQMFKGVITAFIKSNPGYVWNWDENTLIGKLAVGCFGDEEYIGSDNTVKTSAKCRFIRSVESLKAGKLSILEKKVLTEKPAPVVEKKPVVDNSINDLPF